MSSAQTSTRGSAPGRADASPEVGGSATTSDLEVPSDFDYTPAGKVTLAGFSEKLGEVLGAFGAPPLVTWSARQNVTSFVGRDQDDEIIVIGKLKKFCESFSAKLFETPHDPVPILGNFGKWVRARLRRVNKRSVSLAQTLFRLKAVVGHSTSRMGVQVLRQHCATTASNVSRCPDTDEVFDAIKPVLDQVLRTVREKFELPVLRSPARSTGSTQSSRAIAGKAGRLIRAFLGYRETHPLKVQAEWGIHLESVASDRICPPLGRDRGINRDVPERHSTYGRLSETGRWQPLSDNPEVDPPGIVCEDPVVTPGVVLETCGFRDSPEVSYPGTSLSWTQFVVQEALDDISKGVSKIVHVSLVKEAGGKCRTVTSGSAAGATISAHWQQLIFEGMRSVNGGLTFPSLSRTIDGSDFTGLLGSVPEGMIAASSDFKAASDLLDPALTNRILEYLCQGYPWAEIVMDDNADKVLKYPPIPMEAKPGYPYQVVQVETGERLCVVPGTVEELFGEWKWRFKSNQVATVRTTSGKFLVFTERLTCTKRVGQLMGQNTSFPLLSLANLACSLAAMNRHRSPDLSDKDHLQQSLGRVITNGDDRVSLSTPEIEEDFWRIGNSIGLFESTGKSHRHTRYASLNSRDYVRSGGTWVYTQALRAGLLYGIKKLESDQFMASKVVTALFESVPRQSEVPVIKIFLRNHGRRISEELKGRNLFLPISLGGAGQVPPESWIWTVTDFQSTVADRLRRLQPHAEWEFGPPRSPEIFPETGQAQPWDLPDASVRAEWVDPVLFEEKEFRNRFSLRKISKEAQRRSVVIYLCPCGGEGCPGSPCPRCRCPLLRCRQVISVSHSRCRHGCVLAWGDDECLSSGMPHDLVVWEEPRCGCGFCRGLQSRVITREIEPVRVSKDWLASRPLSRPNRELYPLSDYTVERPWGGNPEMVRRVLERRAAGGGIPLPL